MICLSLKSDNLGISLVLTAMSRHRICCNFSLVSQIFIAVETYLHFLSAFRMLKLDKSQGSWSLEFPGLTIIIIITPDKVVVNGKTIIIKRNKNKKYPFSQGWISFQFEGWTYYFKTNENLAVRVNRNGEMVKGKVGKKIYIIMVEKSQFEGGFYYRRLE